MPDLALLSVIAIVLLALVFDFTNGFHDAANSIATVVSTRVLTPRMAVIWAATFNFVAFFVFHTKVANTVGKTVDSNVVSEAGWSGPSPGTSSPGGSGCPPPPRTPSSAGSPGLGWPRPASAS